LAALPVLAVPIRALALALVERGSQGWLANHLFSVAQAVEYCRGLREAGGVPRRRPLRVLAYHAIEDTADAGRFAPYGVRPEEFRRQIAALRRAGYQFVSADEVVHFVRGFGGLPRRPVLLTFDDCYASVLEHALPVLDSHGIPAVAFAVTGRVGGVNDWSRSSAASQFPLLDADGLRRLARGGVEIGAHSRTHPQLPRVGPSELADEVGGSCEDLERMGLGPVRLFAYPYGEFNASVLAAVERAGCRVGFTVEPGLARPGVEPCRIPRIEILREDVGWRFLWKVTIGGWVTRREENRLAFVRGLWRRWGEPTVRSTARRVLPPSVRAWLRKRRPHARAVPASLR